MGTDRGNYRVRAMRNTNRSAVEGVDQKCKGRLARIGRLVLFVWGALALTGCGPEVPPQGLEEKEEAEVNSFVPLTGAELKLFLNDVDFGSGWFSSNGEVRERGTPMPPLAHYEVQQSNYCVFVERTNQECYEVYVDDFGRYFVAQKGHPVARSASYRFIRRKDPSTVRPN